MKNLGEFMELVSNDYETADNLISLISSSPEEYKVLKLLLAKYRSELHKELDEYKKVVRLRALKLIHYYCEDEGEENE